MRCGRAVAAASALALFAAPAAVAEPLPAGGPLSYSDDHLSWTSASLPRPRWVLDTVISYGFNNNYLSPGKLDRVFDGWAGVRPGVIKKGASKVSNSKLVMQVKREKDDVFDFAAVNTAANVDECPCEYNTWTTPLVKTKADFQFGYLEVKMKLPATAAVGNIWLQGVETEISAVEVSEADPAAGIRTAAYHFNNSGKLNLAQAERTTANAFNKGGYNVYGLEWRTTGDILVYVNGVLANEIPGSEWNPSGVHEPMKIILDASLNVPLYGEPDLSSGEKVSMLVDYIAVWELDCADITTTDTAAVNGGSVPGVIGDGCRQTMPFAGQCVHEDGWKRGESCSNPEPGSAAIEPASAKVCRSIPKVSHCGGTRDAKAGGGHGNCAFFNTAKLGERCQPATDCSAASGIKQTGAACGGRNDFNPGGSFGKCVFCFGECRSAPPDKQCNAFCRGQDETWCKDHKSNCAWQGWANNCKAKKAKCPRFKEQRYCEEAEHCKQKVCTNFCTWSASDGKCKTKPKDSASRIASVGRSGAAIAVADGVAEAPARGAPAPSYARDDQAQSSNSDSNAPEGSSRTSAAARHGAGKTGGKSRTEAARGSKAAKGAKAPKGAAVNGAAKGKSKGKGMGKSKSMQQGTKMAPALSGPPRSASSVLGLVAGAALLVGVLVAAVRRVPSVAGQGHRTSASPSANFDLAADAGYTTADDRPAEGELTSVPTDRAMACTQQDPEPEAELRYMTPGGDYSWGNDEAVDPPALVAELIDDHDCAMEYSYAQADNVLENTPLLRSEL